MIINIILLFWFTLSLSSAIDDIVAVATATVIIFSTIIKSLISNNAIRCTTGARSLFASNATTIVVIYKTRSDIIIFYFLLKSFILHYTLTFHATKRQLIL